VRPAVHGFLVGCARLAIERLLISTDLPYLAKQLHRVGALFVSVAKPTLQGTYPVNGLATLDPRLIFGDGFSYYGVQGNIASSSVPSQAFILVPRDTYCDRFQ